MSLDKKRKIMVGMIALIVMIIGGSGIRYYIDRENSVRVKALERDQYIMEEHQFKENRDTPVEGESHRTGEDEIQVDLEGAVKNPGIYTMKEGDRLDTLITAAGGFTDDAQTVGINRAKKVEDEGYYYIPTISEVEEGEVSVIEVFNNDRDVDSKKTIDINTADVAELLAIPGVGEVRAQAIIQYREKNGGFKSTDELKNISGIGDKTFEKLRDYVDTR